LPKNFSLGNATTFSAPTALDEQTDITSENNYTLRIFLFNS